jgi:hypothetical protein
MTTNARELAELATAYAVGNGLSFRNRIINGDMRIDQRNNGASVTPGTGVYTLDRWIYSASQASKVSIQQNAGNVARPAGFTDYLGVTSLSAYSVASNEAFRIDQRIEGFNVADLDWGAADAATVTLSFWVRSSLTGTFGGALQNSAANRSYPFSYTVSSANTWTNVSLTIAGDTTGTWLTNDGIGLRVLFALGVGSGRSGTAGVWAAGQLDSATGAVSVVGTSGATFYITGVQLEAGSVATPFERRPYGTELALCQRYYWQQASGSANLMLGIGTVFLGNNMNGFVQFPVTMRAAPSLVQTTGSNFYIFERDATSLQFNNFTTLSRASKDAGQLYISGLSGTNGQAGILFTNNASAAVGYSAEL